MLCILSRTYPFFRAPDDVTGNKNLYRNHKKTRDENIHWYEKSTNWFIWHIIIVALAEITTVMGSEAVVQAAEQYGKSFICSEKISGVDLQDICYKVMNDGTALV